MKEDDVHLSELLAEMRELRAEVRRQSAPVATPTIRELYELFKAAHLGATSWVAMETKLRPVVAKLGDRVAMLLTVGDMTAYRLERRQTPFPGGKGRCYSDLTINFEFQWLKTLLTWSAGERLIPYNPLASLKGAKTRKHRKTSPTEEEITRLLAEASTLMRAFILFAVDSGMRRDEIRLMRWEWIDETARVVNLPAEATKSNKDRCVPVTERTFAALHAMPRHLRSPYPFCNHSTELPYGDVTIDRWFADIVDASGVRAAPGDRRVHLHDCRHAYARRAARAGVRIEIISLILGHSNIQQTLVYIQTGEDDVIAALDTFEKEVSRKPPKVSPVGDRAPNTAKSTAQD